MSFEIFSKFNALRSSWVNDSYMWIFDSEILIINSIMRASKDQRVNILFEELSNILIEISERFTLMRNSFFNKARKLWSCLRKKSMYSRNFCYFIFILSWLYRKTSPNKTNFSMGYFCCYFYWRDNTSQYFLIAMFILEFSQCLSADSITSDKNYIATLRPELVTSCFREIVNFFTPFISVRGIRMIKVGFIIILREMRFDIQEGIVLSHARVKYSDFEFCLAHYFL